LALPAGELKHLACEFENLNDLIHKFLLDVGVVVALVASRVALRACLVAIIQLIQFVFLPSIY